ncbi:unnamed protein product [Auanema sp. JU1783]|nr:unnamed protein product [Auanema sp. JU1783]
MPADSGIMNEIDASKNMALNSHDALVFESFYYPWFSLTVVGVLGTFINIFVIVATMRGESREMSSFYKVLLNLQISSAYTLVSYTILINQIYVDGVTYCMGIFTLVFSMNLLTQTICQRICYFVISMSYCVFTAGFYHHFIPPTSRLYLGTSAKRTLLIASYVIAAIVSINDQMHNPLEPVVHSDYGYIRKDAVNTLLLGTGVIAIAVCVISHIIYSIKFGPVLSEHTRKNRLVFVKAFIIMLSIPVFNSTILGFVNMLLVPEDRQSLKVVINGFTHYHLFMTNLSYLFFIKPIRKSALKMVCGNKLDVRPTKKERPISLIIPRERAMEFRSSIQAAIAQLVGVVTHTPKNMYTSSTLSHIHQV